MSRPGCNFALKFNDNDLVRFHGNFAFLVELMKPLCLFLLANVLLACILYLELFSLPFLVLVWRGRTAQLELLNACGHDSAKNYLSSALQFPQSALRVR